MKVTKQQKILAAVLLAGAVAFSADRLFVLKGGTQDGSAASSEYAMPTAAAAGPKAAAATQPAPSVRLAQRLRDAGRPYADNPIRDAFAASDAWKPAAPETPKVVGDPTMEQFRRSHRLTGVLSASGQSYAMVDGKILRVGQVVDGYRLTSISHRSVTFESGGSKAVLNLAERAETVAGAGQ